VVERCNQIAVHPRHPYAGDLVYTAFSGSHQDAIRKGFAQQAPDAVWEVPYLPIDPADVGRSYDAVIRVNSQSGKGGATYLLERAMGFAPPRRVQIEFSHAVQAVADQSGAEVSAEAICALFAREYFDVAGPVRRVDAQNVHWEGSAIRIGAPAAAAAEAAAAAGGAHAAYARRIAGEIATASGRRIEITSCETVRATGGRVAVFVGCRVGEDTLRHGAAIAADEATAVIDAVVSGINRSTAWLSPEPIRVAA
jgi:2-isopropylmalate synthase